jgi:hypothetical protein
MANEANQTAAPEEKARTKVAMWQLGLAGLCFLLSAALFLPSLAVLGVCLAPTVIAFLADRSGPKFLTVTVGLPNLCGSIPALVQLWSVEQSFEAVSGVLAGPLGWAMPFGAAGLGLFLYMAMPPMVAVYYSSAAQARERALRRLQTALVETWGEDVAGEHADTVQPSETPDIEAA